VGEKCSTFLGRGSCTCFGRVGYNGKMYLYLYSKGRTL
jgi:hypothetical protein